MGALLLLRPGVSSEAAGTYRDTVLADAPVSYWRLGETSGTTAADQRSRNAGAYGAAGVTLGAAGAIAGDADKAITLDGANGFVRMLPLNGFGTTEVSVELWVKTTDTARRGTIFSYATNQGTLIDNAFRVVDQRDIFISVNQVNSAGGPAASALADTEGRQASAATGISVNDGRWHQIVVTWRRADGQTLVYKDGHLAWSGTLNAGTTVASSGSLVLAQDQDTFGGGFNPTEGYAGLLDEVSIYDHVLSADRILAHFQAGAASYRTFVPLAFRNARP